MKGSWRRWFLLAFLGSFFFSVSAAGKPPQTIDPFLIVEQFNLPQDGNDLTLPVTVFGRTRPFVLDTGSSWMLFDNSLRRHLGEPTQTITGSTPSGKVSLELFEPPRARLGVIDLNADSLVACQDSEAPQSKLFAAV